jgi:hypothetical protein
MNSARYFLFSGMLGCVWGLYGADFEQTGFS